MRRRLVLLIAAITAAVPAAALAGQTVGPGSMVTPNGRHLDPAGRLITLGAFPTGGALTPDGRFYWAVDAGRGVNAVRIVNVKNGKVKKTMQIPGGYVGIAFDPSGRRAYVSGEPAEGEQPPNAVGTDGDVIHVYRVKRRGAAREVKPIVLPSAHNDGAAAQDELPPASGVNAWPEGLAVTPDGKYLVVALGQADQAAIVDLATGEVTLADAGRYPYGVAVDPTRPRAYVTNERDGTVSVISLPDGALVGTIGVGGTEHAGYRHPEGLVADPRRPRLYVAVTDRDLVSVINTRSLKLLRTIDVSRPKTAVGSAPVNVAVSPDERTLYVANAGEDAVAGIALTRRRRHRLPTGSIRGIRKFKVIGRFPTASYPTDVELTRDGRKLVWLASRGLGTGPNPNDESIKELLTGRIGVLNTPTDRRLRRLTTRANRAVVPANHEAAPARTPIIGPDGGPSTKIKYVFYVVKENRTYDQVFGSDPRGEGDPSLELIDDNDVPGPTGGITPNAHALSRRFSLLDNVYADSEESTAGHKITAGGYVNDYTLRYTFTNRGRKGNPDIFPIGIPPNAFIFDQAARQGVSFHVYGELGAGNQPFADDGRPSYGQVQTNTDPDYASQVLGTCRPAIPVPPGTPLPARCTADAGAVGSTAGRPAVNSRINSFASKFQAQVASGTVPALNYMILFNNHTDGDTPGLYSPRADFADNDLALGQLVDLVSHSAIWSQSAIFVVEDDSQDGADHVDAHRIPAFVISPWAKHGGRVISTRYDHYSFLRTAELILGLDPLSINDSLATPLFDAFISGHRQPDVEGTRYRAIQPQVSMTEVNSSKAPAAALSAALPFDRVDAVPQRISDRILWHSIHGRGSTPPPPGPDHSPIERERAVGAMRHWRSGHGLRAFLTHGAADADG